MNRIDPQATKVVCLAERYDCNVYQKLLTDPESLLDRHYQVEAMTDQRQIKVSFGSDTLYILPGRQLITSENIELLALSCSVPLIEGQTAQQTVKTILAAGGVPVVAWSPGKWFFNRGRVVANLLQSTPRKRLLIGDTSLRPLGWGLPSLIRRGARAGFGVVAGSDPLPFAGEENLFGAYVSSVDSELECSQIYKLPQQMMAGTTVKVRNVGKRSHPLRLGLRLIKNNRSKRT